MCGSPGRPAHNQICEQTDRSNTLLLFTVHSFQMAYTSSLCSITCSDLNLFKPLQTSLPEFQLRHVQAGREHIMERLALIHVLRIC